MSFENEKSLIDYSQTQGAHSVEVAAQERLESYFAYLRKRSIKSYIYRKFWLYPFLRQHLSGRVLDVGCGTGDFLASCCPGSIGTDINPLAVEWCRERGLEAVVMEEGCIPFPDNSFDSVVLDNVIEHLSDPMQMLREVCRVLTSRGILVAGVPGIRGYARDPDHKVFYDEAALVEVMAKVGLERTALFHMPIRSSWLRAHVRQYCIYGVFRCG
jgi:SAM-dependent methyltransferase